MALCYRGLASVIRRSAWHGPLSAHQQARWCPPRAARSTSCDGGSTPPGAAISPRIQRPCWATAMAALPHSTMVKGLPQRVVRSTFSVFAGIFQPALRLSWTRWGAPAFGGFATLTALTALTGLTGLTAFAARAADVLIASPPRA